MLSASPHRVLLSGSLLLLTCIGCGESAAIRTYVVENENPNGLTSEVLRREFPALPFEWQVPEAWSSAGNDQFSMKAWNVGDDADSARITLGRFPARTGIAAQVMRWQGQVGLDVKTAAEAMKAVEPLKTKNGEGSYATARGEKETILAFVLPVGSQFWIFRFKGSNSVADAHGKSFHSFCQSLKFTGSADTAAKPPSRGPSAPSARPARSAVPLQWKLPESWSVAKNDQFSRHAWNAGPAENPARITLGSFPARVGIPPQIMRWRGQVGLSTDNVDEAMQSVESLPTQNGSGSYAAIQGDKETILAFILPVENQFWILRFRGPSEVAAEQMAAFREFCGSFRYVDPSDSKTTSAAAPAGTPDTKSAATAEAQDKPTETAAAESPAEDATSREPSAEGNSTAAESENTNESNNAADDSSAEGE